MRKLVRTLVLTAGAALMLGATAFAAEPIRVQVNDQPIAFTDAQPEAKDGRTYIPMRATFNALGFSDEDIAWDNATSTVTAKRGDLTIALKLGEKKITITEAGETHTIDTDAAAYASKNRTYVPVRFVAEAAGCNVGWDSTDRIVLIDDVDALLASNTETYELMDQYLAYSKKLSEGNIAMKGDIGMSMSLADLMDMSMGGTFDAIGSATAVEMKMDLDMLIDMTVPDENGVETNVQQDQALTVEACGDMDDGVMYFKSDELTAMMGAQGDVWFKMDMNEIMSMEGMEEVLGGMDYSALLKLSKDSLNMSFEESLAAVLKLMPLTDDELTAKKTLDVINSILADSAFQKNGTEYVSEFEMDGIELTIVLPTSGGKVNGFSASVAMDGRDVMYMEMKGSEVVLVMQMVDEESGMALEMTLGASYSKASRAPVTEPPANAVIVDYLEMMEMAAAAA